MAEGQMTGNNPNQMSALATSLLSARSSLARMLDSLLVDLYQLEWRGDSADRFQTGLTGRLDREQDGPAERLKKLADQVQSQAGRQEEAAKAEGSARGNVGQSLQRPTPDGEMESLFQLLRKAGLVNSIEGFRQLGKGPLRILAMIGSGVVMELAPKSSKLFRSARGFYGSTVRWTLPLTKRTLGTAPWIDSLVLAPQAIYYGVKYGFDDASSAEHSLDLVGTWGSWAAGGPLGAAAWGISHGGTKYLLEETQWGRDAVDGMVISTTAGGRLEAINYKLAAGESLSPKEMDYLEWKSGWGAAIFWD